MTTEARIGHGLQRHGRDATLVVEWLSWSDQDYLAARILFLRAQVVQGAVLANTAIEKYLKTICIMRGLSFENVKHDCKGLLKNLRDAGVELKINDEFLGLLKSAYKLRYPDELTPGFRIALNGLKTLAALDLTVKSLRDGFRFESKKGRPTKTRLEDYLERSVQDLVFLNCAFGTSSKEDVLSQPSPCYELRIINHEVLMESSYTTLRTEDDEKFDYNAFAPVKGSGGRSFKLVWLPIEQAAAATTTSEK